MAALPVTSPELDDFLKPFRVDAALVHRLALDLCATFQDLAANSDDQFLPTPISESILLSHHDSGRGSHGPYLAIDIGGTNLRVGFVELGDAGVKHDQQANDVGGTGRDEYRTVRRHLETNWSIEEHLKNENADALFAWIGARIAEVVEAGSRRFASVAAAAELPMGVTFSFPMDQESLNQATLRPMGKGFAITSRVDLGRQLLDGYETARGRLPRIRITAITNDAVATFVSFMHQFPPSVLGGGGQRVLVQRPAMGLICGTGSNATILMPIGSLKETKRPKQVKVLPSAADSVAALDGAADEVKIAVNTEWSINGSAPPLRAHGLVSRWDEWLSKAVDKPGFQPLEYMTAGRYLGELGRIVFVDYLTTVRGLDPGVLPAKLLRSFDPHNTTFLSHYKPNGRGSEDLVAQLTAQFPPAEAGARVGSMLPGIENIEPARAPPAASSSPAAGFTWTADLAEALYHIARAIELRAAGLIAAATVGLLKCSGALPEQSRVKATDKGASGPTSATDLQLTVGYTGGCITHFQDYLQHCQQFLDEVVDLEYPLVPAGGRWSRVRIALNPCHDGGIDGAGILVPAAEASD